MNVYAICSTDQYRLDKEANTLIASLNIEDVFRFNATDIDEGDLLQELNTPSLFGDKVIVITHPIFLENDYKFTYKKDFINYFTEPNPDITLILLIDFLYDKNNELIKLISSKTKIKHLASLDEKDLNKFIVQLLKEEDYSIDEDAINELIKRTKSDSLMIGNELEKLKMYCDNKNITISNVVDLVTMDIEKKMYELTNLYFDNNTKSLMQTYYDLVLFSQTKGDGEKRFDVHMGIVTAFINKTTELFYTKKLISKGMKSAEIAEFYKVKPGQAYHMEKAAKKISMNSLKELIDRLQKLDYDLKTNISDKNLAIELFLLNK